MLSIPNIIIIIIDIIIIIKGLGENFERWWSL